MLFRSSYINNANDNDFMNGLVPSIGNDVLDLNPGNLFRIMDGNPIPGARENKPPRFELLPCKPEHFENYNLGKNKNLFIRQDVLGKSLSENLLPASKTATR